MRKGIVASIVFCLGILAFTPLSAQDTDSDRELWTYIQRQSRVWYETYHDRHGAVDPGVWREPIEAAFLRLMAGSGEPGFSISWAVLQDKDFNASCFPGGQFVIHRGTLETIDGILRDRKGIDPAKADPAGLKEAREDLLSPIIAHELGHYYARHTFASIKAQWNMAQLGQADLDMRMVKFSQDNEFEADRTGYLLLQRAGYDPKRMLVILELLNSIQQDQLKSAPNGAFNVYLSSHPSPHARLAAFQGESQGLHALAAELERAFSDVQLGRNLDKAKESIDKALSMDPANLYLKKERAVILHKMWLQTVTLRDQKLRGVLDSPAFRDEMAFSSRGTRGATKVLPGDRALWLKAREAYLAVDGEALDPAFDSNFALLLCYATGAADLQSAVQLAYDAAKAMSTFAVVSNLAVVLYLTGQEEAAMEILSGIASEYDAQYSAAVGDASWNPMVAESLKGLRQRIRLAQSLDAAYVHDDFTPLLNLSLLLSYAGRKQKAAAAAADYLARYEAGSSWAQFLAATTGAALPKPPARKALSVLGVAVGAPLTSLVEKWGKADGIAAQDGGGEEWSYGARKAVLQIQDGVVSTIQLDGPESPRVEGGFGVGSTRAEIEALFGKPRRKANPYTIYEGSQNLAVLYARDVSQRIILFP